MINDFFTINIHEYFISDELMLVLNDLIGSFDCSTKNKEVDGFLKGSAISFAQKGQSATYLVFADEESPRLVGYYTLAIKPITVPIESVSSKNAKKFERVCRFNEEDSTYHFSAFLLAQLGKNYSLNEDLRISGGELLKIAESEISRIKKSVGGIAVFLECENEEKLIELYSDAGYKKFGSRKAYNKYENKTVEYLQYIKTI